MRKIDEIIISNRDFFEDNEPSKGHLERFSKKLEKRFHTTGIRRSIVPYLLKAAVVTLLVTLSSLWTWEHFIRADRGRMALGDVSPQYKEVESYYIHQVNMVENQITDLDLTGNAEQKELLKEELRSMDSVYIHLQKELKVNPHDERIINAMIEHYQTKLEIMSLIVNQLEALKKETINTDDDEKVNI